MKQIRNSYKKTGRLYHAYGILGNRKNVEDEIISFLVEDLKFPIKKNPDFWCKEYNVFKVDDSRALNVDHLNKPVKYNKKIFLILANSITRDAQNSLLKIFEEPKADTTFFLVLPGMSNIIPTLRSRIIFGRSENTKLDSALSADDFLSAKVGKRLEITSKIAKDIKDEKITKSDAVIFIKNLEKIIKSNWKLNKMINGRGENLLAVEDIEKAISYAGDESPSIKVILDHLALVL